MEPPSDANWWVPLERHRRRRSQGVPTITLLLGEPNVADWLWSSWQSASGVRSFTSRAAGSRRELSARWLSSAGLREAFQRRFRELLAARHAVSLEELEARLGARGPSELREFAEREALGLGLPRELALAALDRTASLSELVAADLRSMLPALARVLGNQLPALLIQSDDHDPATFADAACALLEIVEAVPAAEIALAARAAAPKILEGRLPSRLVTLLREGTLRLEAEPAPRGGSAPGKREGALLYPAADFARSEAERRLYQELERRPLTEGLFTLNCRLRQRFGSSGLEIDLVCESLRVAVEVDGYHHFRDSEAYRRDRHKDQLLQELGYLVVRVLAADVSDDIDHVMQRIDRAVYHRKKEGPA
jgi:very-short-patch-repair endonuclease